MLRNLCVPMAGISTPPIEIGCLCMCLVHGLFPGFGSLLLVSPIMLNLSIANSQWCVYDQYCPPLGHVIMSTNLKFASSNIFVHASMRVSSMKETAVSPLLGSYPYMRSVL